MGSSISMASQQDFIKGWPSRHMLEGEDFKAALKSSFTAALDTMSGSALNYGTKEDGAYMIGHPAFQNALAQFLSKIYGKEVNSSSLMSMGGSSMGTDIIARVYSQAGDIA